MACRYRCCVCSTCVGLCVGWLVAGGAAVSAGTSIPAANTADVQGCAAQLMMCAACAVLCRCLHVSAYAVHAPPAQLWFRRCFAQAALFCTLGLEVQASAGSHAECFNEVLPAFLAAAGCGDIQDSRQAAAVLAADSATAHEPLLPGKWETQHTNWHKNSVQLALLQSTHVTTLYCLRVSCKWQLPCMHVSQTACIHHQLFSTVRGVYAAWLDAAPLSEHPWLVPTTVLVASQVC
jgi:hypothetical protein